MNFNVYVPKETGVLLSRAAKNLHCNRNSIVTEALEEWLYKHLPDRWPDRFFDFSPIENVPDFKVFRIDLSEITNEVPLA